jgi:hypothetical protein
MKKILILSTFFLLVMICHSCKEENFTQLHNEEVKEVVIADIKSRIATYNYYMSSPNFTSISFEQTVGYPKYDLSKSVTKENGQEIVLVPTLEQANSTSLKNIIVSITIGEELINYSLTQNDVDSGLFDIFQFLVLYMTDESFDWDAFWAEHDEWLAEVSKHIEELPFEDLLIGGGSGSSTTIPSFSVVYTGKEECPFSSGESSCTYLFNNLISQLENYNDLFTEEELLWLSQANNQNVVAQIIEYINQNGGTLSDEQQNNIADHVWLAQTFPDFDASDIGSDAWVETATEAIIDSYLEWSLEPGLEEGISESLPLTLEEFHEYIGSLEQQVIGSVILPHSNKVENNSISNDGIPQGIIQFDYNIVGTEYDGYNPKFRIGFNYEEYPTTIEEDDIENLFIDFKQTVGVIYTDMGTFTPTGPITHTNGNMGQEPTTNVLVITVLGDLTLGVKAAKIFDYTLTRSVTIEFDLFMSSNYDWVNNPNEPRFIASNLHINGI